MDSGNRIDNEQVPQLRFEISQKEKQIIELKEIIANLKEENTFVLEKLKIFESRNFEMEQSQKRTQEKLKICEEDIVTIIEYKCDLSTKLNSLHNEYDSSKHEWTLASQDYAMRITKLQEELGNRERDYINLLSVNDELSAKVNVLENKIGEMQQEMLRGIDDEFKKIAEKECELAKNGAKLIEFREKNRKLEMEIEKLTTDYETEKLKSYPATQQRDEHTPQMTEGCDYFEDTLRNLESGNEISYQPDIITSVKKLKEENHQLRIKLELHENELKTLTEQMEPTLKSNSGPLNTVANNLRLAEELTEKKNFELQMHIHQNKKVNEKLDDTAVQQEQVQTAEIQPDTTVKLQRFREKTEELLKSNEQLFQEIDIFKTSYEVVFGKWEQFQIDIHCLSEKVRQEAERTTKMKVKLETTEMHLKQRERHWENSLKEKLDTINDMKAAYEHQLHVLEQTKYRVNEFEELNSKQSHIIATLEENLQQTDMLFLKKLENINENVELEQSKNRIEEKLKICETDVSIINEYKRELMTKLESDTEKTKSELKQTKHALNDVMETVESLNLMLFDEKFNESFDLITKLTDIESCVMILKEENHELKNKLKLYKKELETTRKTKEDTEGNFRQRMEESAQTEQKLLNDKVVSVYIKQEYQLSTLKWPRLEDKIEEFLKLNEKLSQEIDTLKTSNIVLLQKRLEVETEINFLRDKLLEETRSKTQLQVKLLASELRLKERQQYLEDSLTEKLHTISELKAAYKTQTAVLEQANCRVNEFEALNSKQSRKISILQENLQHAVNDRERSAKNSSSLMSQIQREQEEMTALLTSLEASANKMVDCVTEKLQAEIKVKASDELCVKLRKKLKEQSTKQEAYHGTLIHITSVLKSYINLDAKVDENGFVFRTLESELDTNIGQLKTTLNRLLINITPYKQSASTDKFQLREAKPNNNENNQSVLPQISQSLASQNDVLTAENNKFRKTQEKRIETLAKALVDAQLLCSEKQTENDKLIADLNSSNSLVEKLQQEMSSKQNEMDKLKHNLKTAEVSKQQLSADLRNQRIANDFLIEEKRELKSSESDIRSKFNKLEKKQKTNEEKIKNLSMELGIAEGTKMRLHHEIGAINLQMTMQEEKANIAITQEKEKMTKFESKVKQIINSYVETLQKTNYSLGLTERRNRELFMEIGATNLKFREMEGTFIKLKEEHEEKVSRLSELEQMFNLTSVNDEKLEAQFEVFEEVIPVKQKEKELLDEGSEELKIEKLHQQLSTGKVSVESEQKTYAQLRMEYTILQSKYREAKQTMLDMKQVYEERIERMRLETDNKMEKIINEKTVI